MACALKTGPAVEPLTAAELATHGNIDTTADDAYLEALIKAARIRVENLTGLTLITSDWYEYWDDFPGIIYLTKAPAASVASITYYDSNNALQTLAATDYATQLVGVQPRIEPAYGVTWPTTYAKPNAVIVEYRAGYGSTSSYVPEDLRHAIRLIAEHWYEAREDAVAPTNMFVIPHGADAICAQYRLTYA